MAVNREIGIPVSFYKAGLPFGLTDPLGKAFDQNEASAIDKTFRGMGAAITVDTVMVALEEDGIPVGVRNITYEVDGAPVIVRTELMNGELPVQFRRAA